MALGMRPVLTKMCFRNKLHARRGRQDMKKECKRSLTIFCVNSLVIFRNIFLNLILPVSFLLRKNVADRKPRGEAYISLIWCFHWTGLPLASPPSSQRQSRHWSWREGRGPGVLSWGWTLIERGKEASVLLQPSCTVMVSAKGSSGWSFRSLAYPSFCPGSSSRAVRLHLLLSAVHC